MKCARYNSNDTVRCKKCNEQKLVSEMPKTITGFRFTCKKCLHSGSLRLFHLSKWRTKIPLSETRDAVLSITERPETVKSSGRDMICAGVDGSVVLLSREFCRKRCEWDRNTFGNMSVRGYYVTPVLGKSTYIHRIVCEAFYGSSNLSVNHINGIATDNRPSNLEHIEGGENTIHMSLFLKNKKKAYRHNIECENPWYTRIKKGKYEFYAGSFKTREEAIQAYDTKVKELYAEYFLKYDNTHSFPYRVGYDFNEFLTGKGIN